MADEDYPKIPDKALESEEAFRACVLMVLDWTMRQQVNAKKSRAELHKRIGETEKKLATLKLRVIVLSTVIIVLAEGGERLVPQLLKLLGG